MNTTNTLLRLAVTATLLGALPACSSNPKVEEVVSAPAAARPAPLPLVSSSRGPMVTLEDVLFDFEEATLRPEADAIVTQTASYLRENPDRLAVIEGHTDRIGEESYNLWLSRLRSESVREGLIAAGIDAGRIRVGGFGETRPVASNDTPAGRQANRRVEIVFQRADQSL